MKKRTLNIITIILFSVGVISGLLILTDYLESPHVISKEQAVKIAMKAGSWTQQELDNSTVDTKLLQPKLNNQVALVINPTTMIAEPYPVPLRALYVHENQLIWEVTIEKHLGRSEYHLSYYEIDATNGTLIESSR